MRKLMFVVVASLLMLSGTQAQEVHQVFKYNTARIVWEWAQGTEADAEAATGFTVACGTEAGNYVILSHDIPVTQFSIPVREVLPGKGTYYCVVYAFNADNISAPSNEVLAKLVGTITAPFSFTIE